MHGRIGEPSRIGGRGDLGFDCPMRTALVDVRRIGNGSIDYDFYRARAVTERNRVRRAALTALMRFIRLVVRFRSSPVPAARQMRTSESKDH
jgi:hypothetical protein